MTIPRAAISLAKRLLGRAPATDPAKSRRRELELAYWRAEMTGPARDAFVETFLGYQRTRLAELRAAWPGDLDTSTLDAVEIGCGPIPALGVCQWRSARAIDPLAGAYTREGLWTDPSGAVEPVPAVGERLPLPNSSADLFVCENALDHVEDATVVCAEIVRVLRTGGRLWLLVDEMRFNDELHTGMDRAQINALVENAGLKRTFEEAKPTHSHPMATGQLRSLWQKAVELAL